MGAHNELLYTHAVIIRNIIITHIYIASFYLSESQDILHIILLIIKKTNELIKAFLYLSAYPVL